MGYSKKIHNRKNSIINQLKSSSQERIIELTGYYLSLKRRFKELHLHSINRPSYKYQKTYINIIKSEFLAYELAFKQIFTKEEIEFYKNLLYNKLNKTNDRLEPIHITKKDLGGATCLLTKNDFEYVLRKEKQQQRRFQKANYNNFRKHAEKEFRIFIQGLIKYDSDYIQREKIRKEKKINRRKICNARINAKKNFRLFINFTDWLLATHYVYLLNMSSPPPARIDDMPRFEIDNKITKPIDYCIFWLPKVELSLSKNRDKIVKYFREQGG